VKYRLLTLGFVFASATCVSLIASEVPKEFKQKFEERYKHQKVAVLPPKVLVGLIKGSYVPVYEVNYDHFHSSVDMPKRYEKRNNLDDRTTEEVYQAAGNVNYLEPGEILDVAEARIWKRTKEYYAVDLNLRALAGKRLMNYGVHFRFAFAPPIIEEGQYDTVVGEINKYFLPEAEYHSATVAGQEAKKNVEIQPGTSKEDVIKALGDPLKTITFGKKTILKYEDITIELEESKVVEVKTN
jgi:hypothetical protein